MRIKIDKVLLESLQNDIQNSFKSGQTLTADQLHELALSKSGNNIKEISNSRHDVSKGHLFGIDSNGIQAEKLRKKLMKTLGLN